MSGVAIVLLLAGCSGESVAKLACTQGMGEYKLADSSLQFCYDKAWGEPVVNGVSAKTGSAQRIGFGTIDNAKAPQVWIESKDFQPSEGEKKIKFEFMNAMESNEDRLKTQLKNSVGYNEKDVSPRKADVGGVRAIRADVSGDVNQVNYFVPDAFYGYNMMVSGSKDMAEMIDEFTFDMVM